MAKDRVGNELEAGNLVLVHGCAPTALMRVVHIDNGGIGAIVTGKRGPQGQAERNVRPGVIVCTNLSQTLFDPTGNRIVPELLRILDPDPDEARRVVEMVKAGGGEFGPYRFRVQ